MTLLTPEQIEAVKETTKVISQDPAWRKAIVTVMKTPNLPTITKAASSVNMSVSSFIRHFNVACWKPDEIIRPLLKDAKIFTTNEIDDLVIQGRILYRSGIPDVMRAGAAGAGGAGAAATWAAAGKGAIILKGLAILGGLIAFAVVSYYVAGYLGELWADDPIEPTWLGDPEKRAAYQQAEQGKKQHSVPIYSAHFIATTEAGKDITNTVWSEPGVIYCDIGGPRTWHNIYNYGDRRNVVHGITYGELCDIFEKTYEKTDYADMQYKPAGTYCVHVNPCDAAQYTVTCARKVVGYREMPD